MAVTRVIGTVIALVSLAMYVWHLAKQGGEPHSIWAIVGGIFFIFGLCLHSPGVEGVERKRNDPVRDEPAFERGKDVKQSCAAVA